MQSSRRLNPFLVLLIFSCIFLLSVVNVEHTYAQEDSGACAVTPDQTDGQGFRTSSQGFRTASQGFRTSSQGFRTSSFGFRTSSQSDIEAIIQEMLDNPVTPALLVNDLADIITGSGFNSTLVYLIIADDYSTPDSHGNRVQFTIEQLISAVDANDGNSEGSPNIIIKQVNIADSAINYDATMIAGKIKSSIDELPANAHVALNMSFGLVPCNDTSNPTLVDSDTGDSFTVTNGFNINEFNAGPPADRPFEKLSPVVECIVFHDGDDEGYGESESRSNGHHNKKDKDDDKSFTAYFGYNNPNSYPVEIPIGSENQFTRGTKDLGQPTVFAPGRNSFVFSADVDNGNLIWKLGHKNAKAWKKSPICEGEIPEPPPHIIPEGYNVNQYFIEQLSIPEKFVDEYMTHLFNTAEETDEADPFANIQAMVKSYLVTSSQHATDGNPSTNFAFIATASSGNYRTTLGTQPLKPAEYDEVIAVSASVGDSVDPITFWQLSHDGNILAPGVAVGLAYDGEGAVTDIGAGTSYAAPFVSVLSSLWLTYPGACHFAPEGLPPLTTLSEFKDSNAFFTEDVLDCQFNLPPVINVTFEGSYIDENTEQEIGTVFDPNGDDINLSTDSGGVEVIDKGDGTWSIIAADNTTPQGPQAIEVTATDGRGGVSSATVNVEIMNVAPEATLVVDKTTVNVLETATLSLINPTEKSDVDRDAGFTYLFDCDTSDEFTNERTSENSYGCAYASAGTFAATAMIFDKDDGASTYDAVITVESSEPEACYASSVVSYHPGKRRNGSDIHPSRTDPEKALGAPQDDDTLNFVALGFAKKHHPAGSIVLSFGDNVITNNNGTEPDIRIWETTYRDSYRRWFWYPEAVEVYASSDGEHWVYIGKTSDKDQAYDLGSLAYAHIIKLVDVSNPWRFGRYADGFDVDAVEGFDCEHYD